MRTACRKPQIYTNLARVNHAQVLKSAFGGLGEGQSRVGRRNHALDGVCIGAIWRIRWIDL